MTGDVRDGVRAMHALGQLPTKVDALADGTALERWEALLAQTSGPLSDAEAALLAPLFPADDSDAFGLAWTLVHLLESAPSWANGELTQDIPAHWRDVLIARIRAAQS